MAVHGQVRSEIPADSLLDVDVRPAGRIALRCVAAELGGAVRLFLQRR